MPTFTASTLTWDVARAGGFVAYLLLTLSVALGLALSLGWRTKRWNRFVTNETHRFVTLLALVFTGIHTLAVVVDPFIGFGPLEVLIPLLAHYRPLWIAFGIVSAYLILAIWLSEYARPHIGYAWWRRFHYLSFAGFILALVHGIGTGSDTRTIWGVLIYGGSVVVIGGLLIARLFPASPKARHPLPAAFMVMGVTFGALWAFRGPLQPGWNAIANNGNGSGGTVQQTVSNPSGPSTGSVAPTQPPSLAAPNSIPFQARLFQGSGGTIVVDGQLMDGSGDGFQIQIVSTDGGSGGNLGQIVIQRPDGATCDGTVDSIGNTDLTASCTTTDGASWKITLTIQQGERSRIAGTFDVTQTGTSSQGDSGI